MSTPTGQPTDQPTRQATGQAAEPSTVPLPGAPAVKKTERPHPLTPAIRGWIVLVAILVALFRESFNGEDGGGLLSLGIRWLLLIVVGVVLLAAVAGFVSWYFTRFVIDDEELRVETGALFRNSRKVAFDRVQSVDLVQPLAARIFGLAELRIEAGAGDRGIRLRYLKRTKADQLRDYLLARAHGDRASVAQSAQRPQSSLLTDARVDEHRLVTVPPQLLIFGFLLSSEWLITLLIVVIAFGVTTFFGVTLYALPGLIPLAFGGLGMISRRVFAQFNYTLAESVRGLRITRGLTNLTSQSVPLNRIQGVKISQSLLWKPFGWYRVDIDILGYGSSSEGEQNKSDASSILLPVATAEQTRTALSRVLPGFDLDAIGLAPSPSRARAIRPFDAWTFRYGWDDNVIVSRAGILVNETSVVPHAKAQSVRIEQGPLQRALRLASVHVDTPKGPVNLIARHLDPTAARELALTELDRARDARARDRQRDDEREQEREQERLREQDREQQRAQSAPSSPPAETAEDRAVLERFGIGADSYLGGGGESRVYALDEHRVLRVYRSGHRSSQAMIDQLGPAYRHWDAQLGAHLFAGRPAPQLELPLILDSGQIDGRVFGIDRRMSGRSLSSWLPTADEAERRTALLSYLDTAGQLRGLDLPGPGFARLFGDQPQSFDSLPALIHDQLAGALRRLDHVAFPEAESWARRVVDEVGTRSCEPRLVHGDYFPGNTYVRRMPDGSVVVRGVGDFSPHTLAADPLMDLAGAVVLMELEPYDGALADARWLGEVLRERIGDDEYRFVNTYRHFYAVYFGDDPAVLAWARHQVQQG